MIDPDFLQLLNKYDIVLLNETWLSNTESINLDIDGCTSEHSVGNKSRNTVKGRYSGGISLYYKSELKPYEAVIGITSVE